jgi:hypothetical protein
MVKEMEATGTHPAIQLERALKGLDYLEMVLRLQAQRWRNYANFRPNGLAGRTANRHAYTVAQFAADMFYEHTGRWPTYLNGEDSSPTPSRRMVEQLYVELGIRAHARGPAEWAIALIRDLLEPHSEDDSE